MVQSSFSREDSWILEVHKWTWRREGGVPALVSHTSSLIALPFHQLSLIFKPVNFYSVTKPKRYQC